MGSHPFPGMPGSTATIRPDVVEPPSPEDGTNLKRSLQIDMKGLMGDAVGNMSISPDNRDVVLASRKGLFIIDLETPLHVPRFLPQGGTWDVADVQWNPHLSHNEYIVSTSSEKLLIWNLLLGGRTSIEHVLRSHYRAITDINWHTIEPDVVISTGIDSWLWAWDLRTVQKPIMGLCAFGPGGTQVKWNRVDGNILASSHSNEVLIWDRRKGSLPMQRVRGHSAKIYGIDWAHDRRNELVTCSLDKTIKIWDTHIAQPTTVINTSYPVWRARDLPFGQGVLSLPQRGETTLEMYAHEDPTTPIEKFEGHADVVKEFVWRRGGEDNSEFQLITWSKDKTLRFWPVDTEVVQKAGRTPTRTTTMNRGRQDSKVSFSNPPIGNDLPPTLSAPIGFRGILAEVRAPPPHRPVRFSNRESAGRRKTSDAGREDKAQWPPRSRPVFVPAVATSVKDSGNPGTMSRGPFAGARSNQITTFQWLSNIKVGQPRDGSSGPKSGGDSGNVSRINSGSRPPSSTDLTMSHTASRTRGRSMSKDRFDEQLSDLIPSLNEEITSVVSKLNSPKLKLEKADFKKRDCTFGLQGPWGESTSVFLRATFTFPRDYPQASYPGGIPTIDLEKSPLISMKQRAFILRRLRDLREHQRPCLEKCLRFLLFGDQQVDSARHAAIDSESSSEDEAQTTRKGDNTLSSLRSDKNLAEPRTSQGVFCANGQLVCFDNAPPRIVRNPLREISISPSISSRPADAGPRIFQSPALLSDAVRRLTSAAQDREPQSVERKRSDDANNVDNVLRIMDGLFTFSHVAYAPNKPRRVSENSRQVDDIPSQYALLPAQRSSGYTVYINSTDGLVGEPDADAAARYVLKGKLSGMFKANTAIAKTLGRSDHERVLSMLQVLATRRPEEHASMTHLGIDPLVATLAMKLYNELLAEKDIQMLVFVSVLLLRTFPPDSEDVPSGRTRISSVSPSPDGPIASRKISLEYFDPRRQRQGSPLSPPVSHSPTPMHTPGGYAPPMASPSSSKGSWSSIFNASSMRQLVSGVRAASATTPEGARQSAGSAGNRRVTMKRESARQSSNSPMAKSSWETSDSSIPSGMMYASKRRPTFSQVLSSKTPIQEKKSIIFHAAVEARPSSPFLSPALRSQLVCHVLAYAEMLLAWQLPEKRGELLKLVESDIQGLSLDATVADETLYSSPVICVFVRPADILASRGFQRARHAEAVCPPVVPFVACPSKGSSTSARSVFM
ncbi:uncharacterized protein TRAVEDRAFT_50605 [Trametes versicolor FP-101664 SS1]|uniref:uncharacterized protein n=1 Tax=Trametes versicolor (strain FP-101664) TaxID=717944 RepID=UPI00046223F1|nr:uncharacterized protein TRAVEDRAFT_50605 [Trametes versicolor FP-101664 SS1]EIW56116.1 hypothetical protein TRAVEDRAFT_50605 [Trametes versicolor FP-101664 SS1]